MTARSATARGLLGFQPCGHPEPADGSRPKDRPESTARPTLGCRGRRRFLGAAGSKVALLRALPWPEGQSPWRPCPGPPQDLPSLCIDEKALAASQRGWQTFSIKGRKVNILGFQEVMTAQLCPVVRRPAVDNT